jgi:hypothetical protein
MCAGQDVEEEETVEDKDEGVKKEGEEEVKEKRRKIRTRGRMRR